MKAIPAILATVGSASLFWLGTSFTITAEPDSWNQVLALGSSSGEGVVPPTHPDSHRLGFEWSVFGDELPLPQADPRETCRTCRLLLDLAGPSGAMD